MEWANASSFMLRYLLALLKRNVQHAFYPKTQHETQPGHWGVTLEKLVEHMPRLKRIKRGDLEFADRMIVRTLNSEYDLFVIEPDTFLVSGGWFDRQQLSPYRVKINGCTWGGAMICLDILAAPGMCIEFNNNVLTSPIREVVVYRPQASASN